MVSRSDRSPLARDRVCKPWLQDYMQENDREVESKDGLGLDTKGKKSKKLWVLVFSGHSFPRPCKSCKSSGSINQNSHHSKYNL